MGARRDVVDDMVVKELHKKIGSIIGHGDWKVWADDVNIHVGYFMDEIKVIRIDRALSLGLNVVASEFATFLRGRERISTGAILSEIAGIRNRAAAAAAESKVVYTRLEALHERIKKNGGKQG